MAKGHSPARPKGLLGRRRKAGGTSARGCVGRSCTCFGKRAGQSFGLADAFWACAMPKLGPVPSDLAGGRARQLWLTEAAEPQSRAGEQRPFVGHNKPQKASAHPLWPFASLMPGFRAKPPVPESSPTRTKPCRPMPKRSTAKARGITTGFTDLKRKEKARHAWARCRALAPSRRTTPWKKPPARDRNRWPADGG
jgi:hypothetical protein